MKDLYKPSVQRSILEKLQLLPKKSLSQHFLIDQNILKKIIAVSNPEKEDLVLEIGPGLGTLTEFLLKTNAHVLAIEKDDLLFQHLAESFAASKNFLDLVHGDILTFDLEKYLKKHKIHQKIKVVANLPYKITAPILGFLLKHHDRFSSLTLMVQKEVAERMCAAPRSKEYSSFSVFVQTYAFCKIAFLVRPGSFYPPPKVFSAVVHLKLKKTPQNIDENFFKNFVRVAFSKRRKMARKTLSIHYSSKIIDQIFEKNSISFKSRPEELSPEEWVKLYEDLLRLNVVKN